MSVLGNPWYYGKIAIENNKIKISRFPKGMACSENY